jgi:N-dimethylarginine dimethylaminohydrolase
LVEEEAAHFFCNAVVFEREVVLPEGAPKLMDLLGKRGFHCHASPMMEFLKAGGACKCLAMLMPQRETVG